MPAREGREEDQLEVVADDEDAGEQRARRGVEEQADEQPFLGVELERPPVGGGDPPVADVAVLGEALHGHEERADHPVGNRERQRRHAERHEREPAEEQADRDC